MQIKMYSNHYVAQCAVHISTVAVELVHVRVDAEVQELLLYYQPVQGRTTHSTMRTS